MRCGYEPQQPERLGLATTRLELDLTLDYDDGSLEGSVTHEITNMSELRATEVPLNVGRLMTVRSVLGPDGRSLEFEQNVAIFTDSPRRQVNHVRIRLPQALEPGGQTRLTLEYGGYLVGYTETGSLYIQDRIHEDFSILREDAFAWPALGTLTGSVNRVAPRHVGISGQPDGGHHPDGHRLPGCAIHVAALSRAHTPVECTGH